jgi:hypothetical protein
MLRALQSLLTDLFLYFPSFLELIMDLDALRGLDAGLAFRAVEEVEDDTGSGPALLQSL